MPEEMTEVVDVRFSFYNRKLLQLLVKRAKAVYDLNREKVAKLEAKIDAAKNEKFDEIRTPSAFYCIFENTKASQVVNKNRKMTLFGEEIKLRDKLLDFEDINWVNAALKKSNHIIRVVFFSIMLSCGVSWLFIVVFSQLTDWNLLTKYNTNAPGIDCDNVI